MRKVNDKCFGQLGLRPTSFLTNGIDSSKIRRLAIVSWWKEAVWGYVIGPLHLKPLANHVQSWRWHHTSQASETVFGSMVDLMLHINNLYVCTWDIFKHVTTCLLQRARRVHALGEVWCWLLRQLEGLRRLCGFALTACKYS